MTYSANVHHAVRTLLWCSTVVDPDNHDGDYLEADDYYLAPESWQRIAQEWHDFTAAVDALGIDLEAAYLAPLHHENEGDIYNQLALDWILTRNHHGTGFWDGDWAKPWGDKLTTLSQSRPEFSLYLGEDGFVHLD